ncbi:MAG TPA: class I SAM-dependent methyltransferase [Gemmatimonadales bacterium]|jgi:cyclopropane fatty-acyl-phospholipid synthase-like methyltransferase
MRPASLSTERVVPDAWDHFWDRVTDDQRLLKEDAVECVRSLREVVPLTSATRVLDFGCGWGNVARLLAPHVGGLTLWDDAPRMRRLAREATAGLPNVTLLDLTPGVDSPGGRFDLILANSVGQFMTADELRSWLRRWRHLLAADGWLVVSDLVPPDYPALADFLTLFRFSASRKFLFRALWDAARVMPLYWRTRSARPLLRTSRADLTSWGREAGLAAPEFPPNLTCFKQRITAVYRRAEGGIR